MPGCWVDNAIRYRGVKSELIKNMSDKMLVPLPWQGTRETVPEFAGYEWIKKLPNKKIYFALFQRWPEHDLPSGYEFYIVSFHLETIDIAWLARQQVTGPIIVLFDGKTYDFSVPNVIFIPFYYWHIQLDTIVKWFGTRPKTHPSHKFSAICNRITQSKVWITTKLLEVAKDSSMIKLSDWLEIKNIHNWEPTGNLCLDRLTQIFLEKYHGKEITIDNFDNEKDNYQIFTADPWQAMCQNCVINFTNESFHYSFMQDNQMPYTHPGPFITEKTLKCIVGKTAFIPVGQFETYKSLQDLGFRFDYGFDTNWDLDPGNLSRFEKIVQLIDDLSKFSINDLIRMTAESNEFNQNHVISGQFFSLCRKHNELAIEKVFQSLI